MSEEVLQLINWFFNLLMSLYGSCIWLKPYLAIRIQSHCAQELDVIRNDNWVRQHTYIDHILPRQKEKEVLSVCVCPVRADVRPPLGFHDRIGNRISIPISNLAFDSCEKGRGEKDHSACLWQASSTGWVGLFVSETQQLFQWFQVHLIISLVLTANRREAK